MPNLLWRTHPRKYGKDSRECRSCTCQMGLIRKYDLMLCRKCFRESANIIGFIKSRWSYVKSILTLLTFSWIFLLPIFTLANVGRQKINFFKIYIYQKAYPAEILKIFNCWIELRRFTHLFFLIASLPIFMSAFGFDEYFYWKE